MAEDGKRVEVRMGSFACTIEGYDDPIDKLKEVMSLVQQMISETPALVDVSAEVDNAEVQEALDTEPVRVRKEADGESKDAAREAPKAEPEAAPEPEQPAQKSETDGDFTLAAADTADRIRTPAADEHKAPSPEPDPFKDIAAEDVAAPATADTATAETTETPPKPDPFMTARAADVREETAAPTPPEPTGPTDTTTDTTVAEAAAPLRTPSSDSTTSGRKLYGMGRFAASVAAGRSRKTTQREFDEPQAEPAADPLADPTETAEAATDFKITPVAVPDPVPEAPELHATSEAAHDDDFGALDDDINVNIFASDLNYDAPAADEPAWDRTTPEPDAVDAATEANDYDSGPAAFSDFDQDAHDSVSTFTATDAFDPSENMDRAPDADPDSNLFRSPDLSALEPAADDPTPPPPAADDQGDDRDTGKAAAGSKVGNVFRSLFGAKGRDTAAEETTPAPETTDAKSGADDAEEPFTNIFASEDDAATHNTPEVRDDLSAPATNDFDVAPAAATSAFIDDPEPQPDLRAPEPEEAIVNIFANEADEAPLELRAENAIPPDAPSVFGATDTPHMDQTDDGDPNRVGAMLERLQTEREAPPAPHMTAPGEVSETSIDASPEAAGITAAELAELSGADSVSDKLAASAAWLTLTRGKLRFSRRDVMDVFDGLPGDHPKTLEARIKGYGKLVRSGTLVLIDDGQFALAQTERDRFTSLLA